MDQKTIDTAESAEKTGFRTSTVVTAGVAWVTLTGRIEPSQMRSCRTALDSALHVRAPRIVLDLSRAQLDAESIDMLKWMRGYVAHHGAEFYLTGVSHLVGMMLRRDHLDPLFPILPADAAEQADGDLEEQRSERRAPARSPRLRAHPAAGYWDPEPRSCQAEQSAASYHRA